MSTSPPSEVKVIDFGPFLTGSEEKRNAVAQEMIESFERIGFAYLQNHGIPLDKIDGMLAWSKKLFSLPMDVKKLAPHPEAGMHHRGYTAPGRETLPRISRGVIPEGVLTAQPESKETFDSGKEDDPVLPNIWFPDGVFPGFKEACLDYFWTLDKTKSHILSALALGLNLPVDYFDESHSKADNHLRLLHYPSISAEALVDKDASRISTHSDYCSVTLLVQDSVGGLEVEDPDLPGHFIPVPPIPGTIVVNAADFLTRWSNDRIRSSVHRVRAPVDATGSTIPERYSIAYFCSPNFDVVVDCIPGTWSDERPKRYEPISCAEYLFTRFAASY